MSHHFILNFYDLYEPRKLSHPHQLIDFANSRNTSKFIEVATRIIANNHQIKWKHRYYINQEPSRNISNCYCLKK